MSEMGLSSLASGRHNSTLHYLRGGHQEHKDRFFILGHGRRQGHGQTPVS